LFWFFELLIAALKMSASYNGLGCSNPPPFLKGDKRGINVFQDRLRGD